MVKPSYETIGIMVNGQHGPAVFFFLRRLS